jgi:hypothetical protein
MRAQVRDATGTPENVLIPRKQRTRQYRRRSSKLVSAAMALIGNRISIGSNRNLGVVAHASRGHPRFALRQLCKEDLDRGDKSDHDSLV